jgi:hypothetical protein
MDSIWQDLKYGLRTLGRSPGFAAIVVLILALGIGANTAIFSIVNSVLLRPLAYPDSNRLVRVYTYSAEREQEDATFADFLDWRSTNHSFSEIAATWQNDANLFDKSGPEKIRAALATADLFKALCVRPALGRLFRPSDDRIEHVEQRYGSCLIAAFALA